jgi:hypothetical protein
VKRYDTSFLRCAPVPHGEESVKETPKLAEKSVKETPKLAEKVSEELLETSVVSGNCVSQKTQKSICRQKPVAGLKGS